MAFSLFKKKKRNESDTSVMKTEDQGSYVPSQLDSRERAAYELESKKLDTLKSMAEDRRAARDQEFDLAKSQINAALAVGNMAKDTIGKVADVWNTSKMVERDIAAINAKSNKDLAEIAAKYNFCQSALMAVFSERGTALKTHYDILDKALQSNDRELIIESLRNVSSIVATKPLEDFNTFLNAWNNPDKNEVFELGF